VVIVRERKSVNGKRRIPVVGWAIDITDAGIGTQTISLHLTSIRFHSRWTGYLGLTERNEADYYEYLPRSLSVIVDTITIREGEGDGKSRL
jgi:hypothetical protein